MFSNPINFKRKLKKNYIFLQNWILYIVYTFMILWFYLYYDIVFFLFIYKYKNIQNEQCEKIFLNKHKINKLNNTIITILLLLYIYTGCPKNI